MQILDPVKLRILPTEISYGILQVMKGKQSHDNFISFAK